MANGLRKLIRKARRFSNPLITNRRVSKFGTRLKVEELEERIAPAVTLNAGDFAAWDGDAADNNAWDDADDFVLLLGGDSTVDITFTPTDNSVAGAGDITVANDGTNDVTEAIYIISNGPIGDINLSGILTSATTTNLLLVVQTGADIAAWDVNVNDDAWLDATADEIAVDSENFGTVNTIEDAGCGIAAWADANDPAAQATTGASIGTITMPDIADLQVELHILAGDSSDEQITKIVSSTTATVDLAEDTRIAGDELTDGIDWLGDVLPTGNDGVVIDIVDGGGNSDSESGIGALSFGAVTITGGTAGLDIDADAIASLTITSGITISGASTGGVNVDADLTGANDDSLGAVDIGGITISGAGDHDVLIDGGDTGLASTVSLGDIDISDGGAGDITVTTSTNGSFADTVTVGAVTNAGTGDSDITIQPAGTGDMTAGFTATGLISNSGVALGAMVVGTTSGTLGAVSLAGITVGGTNDAGDVTFQGESIGTIGSSAAIQTSAGAAGDILFSAAGAAELGSMGNLTVVGDIAAGQAGALVTFQANDDMGSIDVTGNVGGAGNIAFTADNGGTADTGNIGNIDVDNATGTAQLGNGAGTVAFSGVDIGDITADDIGSTGTGAVTFTADGLDATDGAGGGVIGTLTTTDDVAGTANVTFTADDGMGIVNIGGDAAQGAGVTLTFDVNQDGGVGTGDDAGSMGAITAQSLGNAAGTGNVVIDTNSGADDNTTERTVGAITITDGNGKLSITAAGDVGLITVTGNSGTGNDLDIDLLNLDGAGDGANADIPDFAGINIVNTATNDTLTLGGAWTIPGIIGVGGSPAVPGAIIVGGGNSGDVMALGANNINIYAGDDVADGFDAAYAPSSPNDPSVVSITAGDITSGGGVITANTKAASDLFTYVKNGETFAVSVAPDVSANIMFDPDGGSSGEESIAITELAGTSASDDLSVTTSGSSDFDVSAITPAVAGLDVRNITIEGDLIGNIGTAALSFGAVNTIIIQGADNGNQFFGDSLKGYASTDSSLVLTGVDILTLDTAADGSEDLVLIAGSTFNFADAAGAAPGVDAFNHHIGVIDQAGGVIGTATVRGVDGAGDSTADPLYLFSGNGSSTAQTGATNAIDPNDLISGSALVSRVMLNNVGGLETDAATREVDGTTEGSFLEFETSIGLVNLTTQLDSISVGIDDNADLTDNAVSTSITGGTNTRNDFDRLGGGLGGSNKSGLNPATSVSDGTAALGNMIVQSMGQSAGITNNINIVVTGNSGPITLTGDSDLTAPDHGDLDVDDGTQAAAIAIGGNLEGALTIPGEIDQSSSGEADILIGIAVDANNDGDWLDAGETPSGSLNGAITIGDAGDTDILVADNVTADIVITGADQDLEDPGLELDGDLNGVKAGGDLGVLGEDVIVVAGQATYIIADGAVNSGIFVGGDEDWVSIEGTGINGPGVLGATGGIYYAEFIDHEAFGDVGDYDAIWVDYAMTVQWAAGGFNDTLDVLGDVYMFNDDNGSLVVETYDGDAMNIGDIFQLEDDSFDVESPADIGVIVVADGATIPTSEALQDLISTAYDVVNSPTWLDTANGNDEVQLEFDGSIYAVNAGGVVAVGSVEISAEISGSMGDIISLNSSVTACSSVHAGESIGSIVASEDISGDFISEGTLAVGTVLDVSTYGLSGVPSWFTGGVLTEVGDIVYGSEFHADGESELVGGVVVSTGVETMGTFYVLAGNMGLNTSNTVEIFSYGDFGGIQVGAGNVFLYIKVVGGEIDTMIAPYYYQSSYSIRPEANIEAVNGEDIVSANNGYASGNTSVSVSSGVIGFVDPGNSSHIDELTLLNLGAGTSASVTGDVEALAVEGNWGGTVTVSGSALGETDGVVDTVSVDGNVESTAVLSAANFYEILVSGTTSSNVTASGTVDSSDPSDPVTMAGSTVASIFLDGTSNVEADWTAIFGKVMTVEVSGNGKADLVLAEGNVSDAALEDIASDGEVGDGGANLGELIAGTRVKLDDVVIQGSADAIVARQINDLFISGNAGDIIANKINAADIGGNLDMLTVQKAKNVMVDGDVDTIHAYKLQSATILGLTDNLYMTGTRAGHVKGQILNSIFGEGVGYQNFNLDDRWDHVKVRNTTGLY